MTADGPARMFTDVVAGCDSSTCATSGSPTSGSAASTGSAPASGGPGAGGFGNLQPITEVNLNTNGDSPGGANTADVVTAVNAFLATLDAATRTKVEFDFSQNKARQTWSNYPSTPSAPGARTGHFDFARQGSPGARRLHGMQPPS
jgi:hypothetical protein